MTTECNQKSLPFHPHFRRAVIASFDGGTLSSDGGSLLLRQVEKRTGILRQFADCFIDHRDADLIEHSVLDLVSQRVYGLALGYEDLNDHDDLRRDPLLATLVGKADPTGSKRLRRADCGKPLAGKSTLNRLELTRSEAAADDRYKKIAVDEQAIDRMFLDLFVKSHRKPPKRIVLDLDATDDPIHGQQEGRFFHGYYNNYCYLPLYIFAGDELLCARLRRSNIDASAGTVEELERIVEHLRRAWPSVEIVIRADSGFAREEIMTWCELNNVDYVLGLAKNDRLIREIRRELKRAQRQYDKTHETTRVFRDFRYSTLDSWRKKRRVIGKAEYMRNGANPRFIVTSIGKDVMEARTLYEDVYCARGEMENRIKEQQLQLFADRTSSHTMRANQLRLWFSSVAYLLMQALRRLGLRGTSMAQAHCETIRLKLLKIGARVKVTVRKIWVSLASGYPYAEIFEAVYKNLRTSPSS